MRFSKTFPQIKSCDGWHKPRILQRSINNQIVEKIDQNDVQADFLLLDFFPTL